MPKKEARAGELLWIELNSSCVFEADLPKVILEIFQKGYGLSSADAAVQAIITQWAANVVIAPSVCAIPEDPIVVASSTPTTTSPATATPSPSPASNDTTVPTTTTTDVAAEVTTGTAVTDTAPAVTTGKAVTDTAPEMAAGTAGNVVPVDQKPAA